MFLYFGTTEDSWAIGNDCFSLAKNLPPAIQQVWDRLGSIYGGPGKAGILISWMATAPDGTYAVMTKGGELLSNRQDLLAAAQPAVSVEHIALSPLGGWFIRFADGTVQIHHPSGFLQTFYSLAGPYLDLRCTTRQYSLVRDVFFGAQEAVIVRTETEVLSAMLPPGLKATLQTLTHGDLKTSGCILGRNTVLCPWNSEYYILEGLSKDGTRHLYQLPTREIPNELVSIAASNQVPSDHLFNSSSCITRYSGGWASPNVPPPPPRPQSQHRPTNSFTTIFGVSPQKPQMSSPTQWNIPVASQHLQPQQYQPAPMIPSAYSPPQDHPPPYQPGPPLSYVAPVQHAQSAQAPSSSSIQTIEILVAIVCKGCQSGLAPSDTAYRVLASQHDIDYYCSTCHSSTLCPLTAAQVVLVAGKAIPERKRSSVGCDGCWKDIKKGQMTWCCKKCWDKDLCRKCWGKKKRHCKHVVLGQVAMMRVGKGKGDDDWGLEDIVEGLVEVAIGGL